MTPRQPVLAVCVLLALTACAPRVTAGRATSAPSSNSSTPTRSAASSTAPATSTSATHPTTSPTAPQSAASRVFAAMSEAQRVGQLLMVDCPSTGIGQATIAAIIQYDVGSVILDGTSLLGAQQTAQLTAQLQRQAPRGVALFISTDQEGGVVQRLRGPGFSTVPSAVVQGTLAPSTLQADAGQWGTELRRAGVNVDLAPVLDTVPPDFDNNPPIGELDREYGRTPAAVTTHGLAVVRGLAAAGVDATVKHFPGLGRVTGNTDVSSGVQDTVTGRTDDYLAPFAAAIKAGAAFVMMSTAIYTRIDASRPAAFSPTIVTGMLRHDLGFSGIVISDDLGAAAQVGSYSIGARAVAFIAAGGDIVLTVDATQAAAMTAAVLARTRTDAAFKAQVDAAALAVLRAKQARGLLS